MYFVLNKKKPSVNYLRHMKHSAAVNMEAGIKVFFDKRNFFLFVFKEVSPQLSFSWKRFVLVQLMSDTLLVDECNTEIQ